MTTGTENNNRKPRRYIWVQHVAVETEVLRVRLRAARDRGDLDASQKAVADGVDKLLDRASAAAYRDDPVPWRWVNWWRGTLVEAAYRNLHAAQAQILDLFDRHQLHAEIPAVVARADSTLARDDPRRFTVDDLADEPVEVLRARMRRALADSYEQTDVQHSQLRSFRNILYLAALFVLAAVLLTQFAVYQEPGWMPLCFPNEVIVDAATRTSTVQGLNCPVGSGFTSAQPADVLVVAMLGALGGALATTLAIRNLQGTSTPYDVPVALAFLKVPLGALTAMLGLVAIQGKFVPGLSVLDSQGQILAYALIFGFAQQLITGILDRRAQNLLHGLSRGESTSKPPPTATKLKPLEPERPTAAEGNGKATDAPPEEPRRVGAAG